MNRNIYCEEAGDLTGNADAAFANSLLVPEPVEEKFDFFELNEQAGDFPEVTGMTIIDMLLATVIKGEDEDTIDFRKDLIKRAERFLELDEWIATEIDNMYDDYRYDHDNYDSLSRERRLRQAKKDLKNINRRARDAIFERYNKDPGSVFDTQYGNKCADCGFRDQDSEDAWDPF